MTVPEDYELHSLRDALREMGDSKLRLKEELQTLISEQSESESDQIFHFERLAMELATVSNSIEQLSEKLKQTQSFITKEVNQSTNKHFRTLAASMSSANEALLSIHSQTKDDIKGVRSLSQRLSNDVTSISSLLNKVLLEKDKALNELRGKIELLNKQLEVSSLDKLKSDELIRFLEQTLKSQNLEIQNFQKSLKSHSIGQVSLLFQGDSITQSNENSIDSCVNVHTKKNTHSGILNRILNVFRVSPSSKESIINTSNIKQFADITLYVMSESAQGKGGKKIAGALRAAAREKLKSNTKLAIAIGEVAVSIYQDSKVLTWWLALLYDAGYVTSANKVFWSLPTNTALSKKQKDKIFLITEALQYKNMSLPFLEKRRTHQLNELRLLYVASSVITERQTGYTIRTHELLKTYRDRGWSVLCLNLIEVDESSKNVGEDNLSKESMIVDGIEYLTIYIQKQSVSVLSLHHFIEPKVQQIQKCIREFHTELVIAASNYENALPALAASRLENCRFVYEVRGLWEYTRSSKLNGWEGSEHFQIMANGEQFVAKHSDVVLAQTSGIKKELIKRGVDSRIISLLPNGVSEKEVERNELAASANVPFNDSHFILGYIGSVVEYEGIDLLITALSRLLETTPNIRLVVVGGGPHLEGLKQIAVELDVQNFVYFAGQVPKSSIEQWYSKINLIVNPRLDRSVTRLVAPLKPLEAMIQSTPVLVSNVDAMLDMVEHGKTGFVFESENVESLMSKIQYVMFEVEKVAQIVRNAFEYVSKKCTWSNRVIKVEPLLLGANNERLNTLLTELTTESIISSEAKSLVQKITNEITSSEDYKLVELRLKRDEEFSSAIKSFAKCRIAIRSLDIGCENQGWKTISELSESTTSKMILRTKLKLAFELALFEEAKESINEFESMAPLGESDQKLLTSLESINEIIDLLSEPYTLNRTFENKLKVFYSLAFSLPHSSVGYSTRSHGILLGMQKNGIKVTPYTRPGFPDDKPTEELNEKDIVDGVEYHRCLSIKRAEMDEISYLIESADYWTEVIRKGKFNLVQSGSNYVTALPALIAARRNNLPFVYEMRGFWEVTRSSRDKSFENTRKYRHMVFFENLVAKQANTVICITTAMKNRLIERGVDSQKISVAYNGVDPSRFVPRKPSLEIKSKLGIEVDCPVIGYVGSIVDYEGLDDLLSAVKNLAEEDYKFKVLIVGDGAELEGLQTYVDGQNLGEYVIFTGRVPHELVEDYYSIIDITPFPRKPWEVCELVSPLKPFEAMAMGKAVVVSDTEALVEIVTNNSNGLTFEKGSVNSLTEALAKLLNNTQMAALLGKSSRTWVAQNRSWNNTAQACIEAYKKI